MVYNALAGIAVGYALGMTDEQIKAGIEALVPLAGRNNLIETGKFTVIDDCYNANPQAMAAALRLLAATDCPRRMAVLGDMGDLGDLSPKAHTDIGLLLNELKLDCVVAVGHWMTHLAHAAQGNVYHFDTLEQSYDTLRREFTPGTVALVKASHSMHFEKIVEELEKV